jgi:hypothetical protein
MVWNPTTWVDNTEPGITAAQLNRIETGITDCWKAENDGSGSGLDADLWRGDTPDELFAKYGLVTVGYNNQCVYNVADYANLAAALNAALTANPYKTIHYIGGNRALGGNVTAVNYGKIDFHGASITIDDATVGIDASATTGFTVENGTFTLSSHTSTNTIIGIKTGIMTRVKNFILEWLFTGIQINDSGVFIHNVTINYGIDTGIDTIASNTITNINIDKVYIYSEFNSSYGFNTAGIRLRGVSAVLTPNNSLRNITVVDIHGPAMYFYYIGGNVVNNLQATNVWNEALLLTSSRYNVISNVITSQNPSYGTSTSPGIGMTTCSDNLMTNLNIRYTKGAGIFMQTTCSRNNFSNIFIYGGSMVYAPQGIRIDSGCNENNFTNFLIRDIGGDGILLTSTSRNKFSNGECYNNTGCGISLASSTECIVSGVALYTGHTYGIYESGTSDFNRYISCQIKTFSVAAILMVGTASEASKCYGYNPIGPITAPSVPSSGTSWTNDQHVTLDVFVYGGTVSSIKLTKSGGTLTTTGMTSGRFTLQPGSIINITYSSVPTWVMMEV